MPEVWIPKNWDDVRENLLDAGAPLTRRYRSLFYVETFMPSQEDAVATFVESFRVTRESTLLRHEAAYVLGQFAGKGDSVAEDALRALLLDEEEDEVVRHEAAEALAAMGTQTAMQDISKFLPGGTGNSSLLLEHTCILALHSLESKGVVPPCACKEQARYTTRDPVEGNIDEVDVGRLTDVLSQHTAPLPLRYQALFSLRNCSSAAAVQSLCTVLLEDTSSAVLRHEIAFVLAQIEDHSSTAALAACLANSKEEDVVRHEAAIALGALANQDAEKELNKWVDAPEKMVAESCIVALDAICYMRDFEGVQ